MQDSTYTVIGALPEALPSLTGQLQGSVPFRDLAQRPYPGRKLQERQDRIERGDELSHLYLTANISEALVLLALNKDLPAVEILLEMVRGAGTTVPAIPADPIPLDRTNDQIPHFASDPYIAMAVAQSVRDPRVPDADWLRKFALGVAAHYQRRSKGNLHAVQQKTLIEGIICALLANDLELASRIAQIRSTLSTSKLLFPLLKRFIKQAELQKIEGRDVIRIHDEGLRGECFAVLDHFRRRVGTDHRMPGDANMYFGMIEGAYLWAWLCLQSCAPQPVLHSDWTTLSDLLIG